jgi:hypothetical protein
MHSASDTYHDAPAYLEMLGNEFLTHGDQETVDAIVELTYFLAGSANATR